MASWEVLSTISFYWSQGIWMHSGFYRTGPKVASCVIGINNRTLNLWWIFSPLVFQLLLKCPFHLMLEMAQWRSLSDPPTHSMMTNGIESSLREMSSRPVCGWTNCHRRSGRRQRKATHDWNCIASYMLVSSRRNNRPQRLVTPFQPHHVGGSYSNISGFFPEALSDGRVQNEKQCRL